MHYHCLSASELRGLSRYSLLNCNLRIVARALMHGSGVHSLLFLLIIYDGWTRVLTPSSLIQKRGL